MHKRYGFELIEDHPDRKVFRTTCHCMSLDHTPTIEVEYDKELKILFLRFNVETSIDNHYHLEYNVLKRLWKKLKLTWRIFSGKNVTAEHEFVFRGRDHVQDFTDFIHLLGKDCEKETNELIECRKKLNSKKG